MTSGDLLHETAAVRAAVKALREAVDRADARCGKDGVAPAWHADWVLRFVCATYGRGVGGVQVGEDGFIVITAKLSGDNLVEVSITVGPEGTRASRVRVRGYSSRSLAEARLFDSCPEQLARSIGPRVQQSNRGCCETGLM